MKKDFIRDEGKVRYCDSNMSKMNIFEFMYYYIFHWGYFLEIFSYVAESFVEFFKNGFRLIWNLIFLIFTPITLPLCAITRIRNAKKWVEKANK